MMATQTKKEEQSIVERFGLTDEFMREQRIKRVRRLRAMSHQQKQAEFARERARAEASEADNMREALD